jgi:hypothetical protein
MSQGKLQVHKGFAAMAGCISCYDRGQCIREGCPNNAVAMVARSSSAALNTKPAKRCPLSPGWLDNANMKGI